MVCPVGRLAPANQRVPSSVTMYARIARNKAGRTVTGGVKEIGEIGFAPLRRLVQPYILRRMKMLPPHTILPNPPVHSWRCDGCAYQP
ncbi:MAG: hypothetical protein HC859_04975 [Bacteroidia bacterium]|nr:hypothetical protein [Bacteroidia bacterium]